MIPHPSIRLAIAGAAGLALAAVALGQSAPAPVAAPAPSASVMAPAATQVSGYLASDAVPDSIRLIPPPPAPGSAAMARDEAAAAAARKLHGLPRWELAARDAELAAPAIAASFDCAAGITLSPATTPRTEALLRRALIDLGRATNAAKHHYMRARPYMAKKEAICTPELKTALRHNGSYPSGHASAGFGWGLILAELLPARATDLVLRGRNFGDSRRVCNVHWLSDVEEGRIVAAAVVARLHADAAFRADMEAARAELSAPGLAAPDPASCKREGEALAAP